MRNRLLAFPLNPERLSAAFTLSLAALGRRYLEHLKKTSRMMLKSRLRIETFEYAICKPILDDIDDLLAKHWGLTDEELDFIVNYDIKYRMGQEGAEDSEE